MHEVPWMCWKRMSDNWKAYFLAYAWPMPISSRILWSLSLQNHFKLKRDSFFLIFLSLSSCQRLVKTYLFWCLFYGEMGKFWRWIRKKAWQASKPFSPRVWPSYLIWAIAWLESGFGGLVGIRKLWLTKTNFEPSSSLCFPLGLVGQENEFLNKRQLNIEKAKCSVWLFSVRFFLWLLSCATSAVLRKKSSWGVGGTGHTSKPM